MSIGSRMRLEIRKWISPPNSSGELSQELDLSRQIDPPNVVIAIMSGGLANQIIIYKAAVLASSWKESALFVDASGYMTKESEKSPARNYQLDQLNLSAHVTIRSKEFSRQMRALPGFSLTKATTESRKDVCEGDILTELREFGVLFIDIWGGLFLRKLSNSFFRDLVDKPLFPPEWESKLSDQDQSILGQIRSSPNPVAVHVRRGDFSTHDGGILVGAQYYLRSMERLSHELQDPTFFVFSDEIPWCRQQFSSLPSTVFVDHNDESTGYKDLFLASRCRHFILSHPSTFSKQMPELGHADPDRIIIMSNDSDFEESAFLREKRPSN